MYLKDILCLQHRQPFLRRGVEVRQLVHVHIAVVVTILSTCYSYVEFKQK